MVSKEGSSPGRWMGARGRLALVLALAGGTALTVSGQSPREWRDYAGGPDSSRFVAATQITKANVSQLRGGVDLSRRARPTSIRWSSRGVVYGRGAERLVRRARRRDRQGDLDSRRACKGFNVPRRELLGERGRQGPPADLQRRQHPPGDRRADRRDASPSFGIGRPGRPARRAGPRSGDGQPAEPHARAGSSRT